jgi:hypothetical protein
MHALQELGLAVERSLTKALNWRNSTQWSMHRLVGRRRSSCSIYGDRDSNRHCARRAQRNKGKTTHIHLP